MTRDDAARLRVTLICEDSRQDRFFRGLLVRGGVHPRGISILIAPAGGGSAAAWVLARYPAEVRRLRAKKHQEGLALVAVVDGDSLGVAARKRAFDAALQRSSLEVRQPDEKIALPVPTWSVETWLWWLLGHPGATESRSLKQEFERAHARTSQDEARAIEGAVSLWPGPADPVHGLPSLEDGRLELERVLSR